MELYGEEKITVKAKMRRLGFPEGRVPKAMIEGGTGTRRKRDRSRRKWVLAIQEGLRTLGVLNWKTES